MITYGESVYLDTMTLRQGLPRLLLLYRGGSLSYWFATKIYFIIMQSNNQVVKKKVRPEEMKRLKALVNKPQRNKNNQQRRKRNPNGRRIQFKGSEYLNSLLNPEKDHGAKIPGSAVPVVSIHRRVIQRFTTNATGCIGFSFYPEGSLIENTTGGTANVYLPLRMCNDTTYNGTTAPAVGTVLVTTASNPFSLPEGTVKQFRLVSSSITCRSLAPALTRSGDIHIALVNGYYNQSGIISSTSDQAQFLALSNIDNLVQGKYTYARVENGQAARAIWIPQDVTCLDFKDINNNLSFTDNFISIIAIGLAASSSVEIVMDFNFEVTSKVGSLLQGMESFCQENIDPMRVWRTAYSIRPPCIASKDLGSYTATAISNVGVTPFSKATNGKKSLKFLTDIEAAQYAFNKANANKSFLGNAAEGDF